MIAWSNNVNKRILKNGTSWNDNVGFTEKKTLSGKPKRIRSNTFQKRPFQVKMLFTLTEYLYFLDWWKNDCEEGFNSFAFPCVDDNSGIFKEYQFAVDGAPRYVNVSADKIECTMKWEEV